ncbi:MAG: ATP synthase subunit I [Bryobacteraceae bacterium]
MTDPEFFDRATRRIERWITAFAVAGAAVAFLWRGWPAAGGFALGAAISWLNYRWMKRLVDSLGGGPSRSRARVAVLFGLRYLILALGVYAILRFLAMSLPALFAGIFVAVAAVLAEIVFELLHARNGTVDHPDF